jgi:hypothetical protein
MSVCLALMERLEQIFIPKVVSLIGRPGSSYKNSRSDPGAEGSHEDTSFADVSRESLVNARSAISPPAKIAVRVWIYVPSEKAT